MASDDGSGFNNFSNDGSFIERFRKMQEEKKKLEVDSDVPPPKKAKPIVMKLSSLKKKKNPFLAEPIGTKNKAFSKGAGSDDEEEDLLKPDPNPKTNVEGSSVVETSEIKPGSVTQSVAGRESMSASALPTTSSTSPSTASASSPPQTTKRKRQRNRWSDAPPPQANLSEDDKAIANAMASFSSEAPPTSHGATQQALTPAQLQQLQEQREMNNLVARIRAATQASNLAGMKKMKDPNKPQYDYDSDEDTEGGTWEHKKRANEMLATFDKAIELTEKGKGKHHIGDFLPPDEMEKFLEKVQAIKEGRDPDFSDYKDNKLDETNVGFRMLRNAGWSEGEGLGEKGDGIVNPINKGKTTFDQAGIGSDISTEVAKDDSMYDTYRKRMMLAYKFRPNPLNNPRRPYY